MAMFSFGRKKKIEELKQQMEAQEYEAAALTADDIPVSKLKSAYELNLVGKAYKCNGDFMQAYKAFQRSYEVRCARTVLLDIMDCCLEIKNLDEAEKYFDEYQKVAPEDKSTLYKYRYRIEKKKGRERRLLITILEELKALDYVEEYAYELAKQYHKAGMEQECMDECNDIILWFGYGPTVERAKTLLAYYKGEISLDDIRLAGAKYQEEQKRRQSKAEALKEARQPEQRLEGERPFFQKEAKQEEAGREPEEESQVSRKELKQEPEQPEVTKHPVQNPAEEYVLPEEEKRQTPAEEYRLPEEEKQQNPEKENEWQDAGTSAARGEQMQDAGSETEEFVLPELDLSGIDFNDSREEEELYVPAVDTTEPANGRLTELLKRKQVDLAASLKNFGRTGRIRKQIIKSLELAISDREKAYFVITGEPQTGKTTLALSFIRLLYDLELVKYDRTATIDAVQLNQVSIADYGEELKNCNLIIENAGGMTKESVDGLLRFSKDSGGKTCVILEDSIRNINKFLRAREDLNSLFNNRIHLGKYSSEELMGFAFDAIEKEDYGIDKMAAKALKDKIDEIVKDYGNDQRLIRTLKFVEVVIARAEKRTSELILSMAADGRIQQGNYLVIILEDVA